MFIKSTRRKYYFRMKSKKKLKISFANETVIFSFKQYVRGVTVGKRLSADNLTKVLERWNITNWLIFNQESFAKIVSVTSENGKQSPMYLPILTLVSNVYTSTILIFRSTPPVMVYHHPTNWCCQISNPPIMTIFENFQRGHWGMGWRGRSGFRLW